MRAQKKPEFQLRNAVLMMAMAAAYPMSAAIAAPAGIAQFTVGDVNVRKADGRAEALVKGKDIESGQAIVTGADGRAQVKFSDGGLISLQPNTEFKVTNYVDRADPKEDRFLVDLLRGSMRAITGLIGKRNRENYKVMTTTATIGIRGSGFNASYNPDGTLGVTTEFDGIEVCNAAGCVGLTAGESVLVLSNQTLPVRTNTRADVPTPQTKQEVTVAGNQVDKDGETTVVPEAVAKLKEEQVAQAPAPSPAPSPSPSPAPTPNPPPPPPPPPPPKLLTGVAFTSLSLDGRGYDSRNSPNGSLLLGDPVDPRLPTEYTSASDVVGKGTKWGLGGAFSTGKVADGNYIVLGAWQGVSWTNSAGTKGLGATVFAAGTPSSSAALDGIRNGMRGTYVLKNATEVYASVGGSDSNGSLLRSSHLDLDFTNAYLDVNLDINFSKNRPASISYKLRGGVFVGNSGYFNGLVSLSGSACNANALVCYPAAVSGGLVGNGAEHIILSYGGYGGMTGTFGGAASFDRSSSAAIPSNNSQTDLNVVVTDGSGIIPNHPFRTVSGYSKVTPSFNGERMDSLTEVQSSFGVTALTATQSADSTVVLKNTQTPGAFGALGKVTDSDFIGWGNWVTAEKVIKSGTYTTDSHMLDSLHYIVGRPTAVMPTDGRASYALVGGTAPTATLGDVTQTGQLLGGELVAAFNTGVVRASISTQFAGNRVDITDLRAHINQGTANFSGENSAGASVSGFFTGDGAYRAGMVYTVPGSQTSIGTVTGAAAFQRRELTATVQNVGN